MLRMRYADQVQQIVSQYAHKPNVYDAFRCAHNHLISGNLTFSSFQKMDKQCKFHPPCVAAGLSPLKRFAD